MTRFRCTSCHRVEVRGLAEAVVEIPGGSRRPSVRSELAIWRAYRAAWAGQTGPLAAVCPACDQPMAADRADTPWIVWPLPGPDGPLMLDQRPPDDLEGLHQRLEAAWKEPLIGDFRPGLWLFQGTLMSTMLLPILLWFALGTVIVTYLMNYGWNAAERGTLLP